MDPITPLVARRRQAGGGRVYISASRPNMHIVFLWQRTRVGIGEGSNLIVSAHVGAVGNQHLHHLHVAVAGCTMKNALEHGKIYRRAASLVLSGQVPTRLHQREECICVATIRRNMRSRPALHRPQHVYHLRVALSDGDVHSDLAILIPTPTDVKVPLPNQFIHRSKGFPIQPQQPPALNPRHTATYDVGEECILFSPANDSCCSECVRAGTNLVGSVDLRIVSDQQIHHPRVALLHRNP